MGIKPKTSFRHCIPTRCSRWHARRATHIPRLPKKKPLRGKKVGSAEKKTAPDAKKWRIVCVKGGIFLPMILATTDPLEALHSGYAISKLRSPAPRLHGFAHNKPSPMATCSPSHPSHPTFCSLPSHSSHHPSKPHQIKQPLSKRAVNERAVKYFAK